MNHTTVVSKSAIECPRLDPYDFRLAVWLSTNSAESPDQLALRRLAWLLGMKPHRLVKSVLRLENFGLIFVERDDKGGIAALIFNHAEWAVFGDEQ